VAVFRWQSQPSGSVPVAVTESAKGQCKGGSVQVAESAKCQCTGVSQEAVSAKGQCTGGSVQVAVYR
jgi:hypothetical protein